MATGIEAAGLVLGAIPLILAGLQFYSEGISVTKRYLKYKEEVNILLYELKVEISMYVNSINILLNGVVNKKEIVEFWNDPKAARWKEEKFDRKLRARLRTSYESYMDSITQMVTIAEKFKEQLKLDKSRKPQFSEQNAFKEHYKRLKFSLKKSDYKDLMDRLRRANGSLNRLTNQTAYLETHQQKRQSVPNFRTIKERADSFYSALRSGWTCPCQAYHTVSLRLEPRMDDASSDDDDNDEHDHKMRDPFHVLFHYNHHHPTTVTPPNTTRPWCWEEADVRVEFEEQEAAAVAGNAQTSNSVRFAK
jgi:hypothetical protein